MKVGQLEQLLLEQFLAKDAEPWDRTGLVVGDPNAQVAKVAVALDPTVAAIKEAASRGANVLVTHHPPFLDAPDSFKPADSVAQENGAGVWTAITNNVALMCFHTALDVSHAAQKILPGIIGITQIGVLDPIAHDSRKGYGQICKLEQPETLGQIALRCADQFGRHPRVWGSLDKAVGTVVTGTGAGGNLCAPCVDQGIDCLICGELKYHACLDLSSAGVGIIELGHDVSELPLVNPLRDALLASGIEETDIAMIEQGSNWTTV